MYYVRLFFIRVDTDKCHVNDHKCHVNDHICPTQSISVRKPWHCASDRTFNFFQASKGVIKVLCNAIRWGGPGYQLRLALLRSTLLML